MFWKAAAIALFILALTLAAFNLDRIGTNRPDPVDQTDYAAAAEYAIRHNTFIAFRLGKVIRTTHVGKGGDTGEESYNVFRVVGENGIGVLNITLTRDEQGLWNPTEAVLDYNGALLEVPVSRATGEKWRRLHFP